MIYLVSMYYPPVSNPPANRMGQLAQTLVERYGAAQVRVVTGRPNYPDGKLRAEDKWRLFRRTRGSFGETVDHLYEFPSAFRGLYRKTFGMLTFTCSLLVYFLLRRIGKCDLVVVTSGPVFVLYGVFLLSKVRRGLRYVADVRDLWPQVVAGMGFMREDSRVYALLMRLSDRAYRHAVACIGNSEGIVAHLSVVSECPDTHLVYNPMDLAFFRQRSANQTERLQSEFPAVFGARRMTTFVFTGTYSYYVGIMTLMQALRKVNGITRDYRFILIGQGEEEATARKYATDENLQEQVLFLPFMARDRLIDFIDAADFCFASLKDTPNLRYAIPTKILEYLACNKFVVAAVACPFAQRLQEQGNALVSPPGDADALAANLLELIRNRDRYLSQVTSRAFAEQNFSVERFRERIFSVLESYICSPPSRQP